MAVSIQNLNFQVPADMITLDTSALGQVDVKTVQEKMEEKKKQLVINHL